MNRLKKYRGLIKKTWFATTGITLLVLLFGVPSFPRFQKTGDNFYKVSINGTEIGNSSDPEEVERLVAEARREITETEGAMYISRLKSLPRGRSCFLEIQTAGTTYIKRFMMF